MGGGSRTKTQGGKEEKMQAVPPVPSILQEEIERLRREAKPPPARHATAPEKPKPPPQPHKARQPIDRRAKVQVHTTISALSPLIHKPAAAPAARPAHKGGGGQQGPAKTVQVAAGPEQATPPEGEGGGAVRPHTSGQRSFKVATPAAAHFGESEAGAEEEDGERVASGILAGIIRGVVEGGSAFRQVTLVELTSSSTDGTAEHPTDSISHNYSTIGRMLSSTGIKGRAEGQFSILAGVAVGPDGLLFVSDRDTASNVDVLRIESIAEDEEAAKQAALRNPLSKILTAETELLADEELLFPAGSEGGGGSGAHGGGEGGKGGSPAKPPSGYRRFSVVEDATGLTTFSVEHSAVELLEQHEAEYAAAERMASSPSRAKSGSPRHSRVGTAGTRLGTASPRSRPADPDEPPPPPLDPTMPRPWSSVVPDTPSKKRRFQGTYLRHGYTVPVRASGVTFIADADNHCLQVLRADGTHLRRIGSFGAGGGQFNSPQGLSVLCQPGADVFLLYVCDTCNHRVQVFSFYRSDGSDIKLVKIIGKEGRADSQFRYPVGLCLDAAAERVYVADTGNDRLQIFTTSGEHLRTVGVAGRQPVAEDGTPCFRSPYDVACLEGLVFVTDEGNHRLQMLTLEGEFVRVIGGQGAQMGRFIRPRCVFATASGSILVSDQENHRVQVLHPNEEDGRQVFRWLRLK